MFCPTCKSLLIPRKEGETPVLLCSCGYKQKGTGKITELVKKKKRDIAVVEKEHEVLPETDTPCPKCNHPSSYYWLVQTRAGDEPETKFHRCVKCKYTWREYQ